MQEVRRRKAVRCVGFQRDGQSWTEGPDTTGLMYIPSIQLPVFLGIRYNDVTKHVVWYTCIWLLGGSDIEASFSVTKPIMHTTSPSKPLRAECSTKKSGNGRTCKDR
jgi:hypothetical protein